MILHRHYPDWQTQLLPEPAVLDKEGFGVEVILVMVRSGSVEVKLSVTYTGSLLSGISFGVSGEVAVTPQVRCSTWK